MRGLAVVFSKPLHKTLSGVSPGGAVFHFKYLQSYDLMKNSIVLRADYVAYQSLADECMLFRSDAPNTSQMFVYKGLIASITDLASGKILFLKTG